MPDFPGFASAGDTQAEACKNTAEGLTGHIALRVEDGEDIPLPTLLDQIRIEPDTLLAATLLISLCRNTGWLTGRLRIPGNDGIHLRGPAANTQPSLSANTSR